MALWNKPLAMGDRIWRENTGDQEKLCRGLSIQHIHHPPFLKETFPGSLLKSFVLTEKKKKKKPWFGDSRTSHGCMDKFFNLSEPPGASGTLRPNILVCDCLLAPSFPSWGNLRQIVSYFRASIYFFQNWKEKWSTYHRIVA